MTIALANGAYFGTSVLFRLLEPWGLRFVEFDQTGPPPPEAELVWVESPANPTLTTPDWEALRAHPGLVVCDATVATPIYLRALDEGADVVIHSGTKFLTGNHAALLGAAVTRDPERRKTLHHVRTQTGGVASPHSASALLAGLDSLAGRMRHITETSTELARRLDEHPVVELVRYPGYSGLISFDVPDPRKVETSTRVIVNATSLGGVNSTMESRHRWEGDRIPAGLLRLSVGLEDVDELWADLERALS
jgi:cystathionine gamma-synthase